jgi:fluoroquinolone transport system permease protein
MAHTLKLFQIGLRQMSKDGMLILLVFAPLLAGLAFKFALPFANGILTERFSFSLSPWYGLVDGLLVCLTPMLTAVISSFMILEERDEGIGAFYQITPAAGVSYPAARVGIPMVWAFAVSVIAVFPLNISSPSIAAILSASLVSALSGAFLAMMVVTLARNRVEGLALSKLMGISLLGLAVVWFAPAPYSYLAAFLPSYWVGDIMLNGASPVSLAAGAAMCGLWTAIFTRRFVRTIM